MRPGRLLTATAALLAAVAVERLFRLATQPVQGGGPYWWLRIDTGRPAAGSTR